jgi:hypothetical protein
MRQERYILSEKKASRNKRNTDEITRILALIVAFISVFAFFVKLLFF